MLADLLFLLFASILLISALGVITARNPMHSVLFLILTFFNASGLFILLGAEFIGLLLIMVYVGAVAVMFLFVIMAIDIDFATMRKNTVAYLPTGLLVGGILLVELGAAGYGGMFNFSKTAVLPIAQNQQNAVALGQVLFTDYAVAFQSVAMILLTAMVGAIVLTYRKRDGIRKQNIAKQIARTKDESLIITHPHIGNGVEKLYFEPKDVEKK